MPLGGLNNVVPMNMNTTIVVSLVICAVVLLAVMGCRRKASEPTALTPPTNEAEFNALFESACTRLKPFVAMGGYAPKKLSSQEATQVRTCVRDLKSCLAFAGNHWQSMVFLAKAHQAMGEHQVSLNWLIQAMDIEKSNHVIPKEASLEAVHLRDIKTAVLYSAEAIRRKPGDPELMGNHAMNLLISGDDAQASATIREALTIAPQDDFNKRISGIIDEVMVGKRARPTCESVMP